MYVLCNNCQRRSKWPEEIRTKQVRCPHCVVVFAARTAMVQEEKGPLMAIVVPIVAEQVEATEVVPVERMGTPGQPTKELRWSEEVKSLRSRVSEPGISFDQQQVFALLARTLNNLKWDYQASALGWCLLLISLGLGTCLTGFLLQLLIGWLGTHLLSAAGFSLDWVMILAPAVFVAIIASIRQEKTKAVSFALIENQIDGLVLGRLSVFCAIIECLVLYFIFFLLIGLLAGLLYASSNHLGLPEADTLPGAWQITWNLLSHGLLFDLFERYGINLAGNSEPQGMNATILMAFRFGFDGCIVVGAYYLYQRHHLRDFRASIPNYWSSTRQLADWIVMSCKADQRLPRLFFDEFLFLLLAEAYLRSDFEMVIELSRRFSRVKVEEDVRRIFLAPDGKLIFSQEQKET